MHTLCFSFSFLVPQGPASCVATPAWFQVLTVHVKSRGAGKGVQGRIGYRRGGSRLQHLWSVSDSTWLPWFYLYFLWENAHSVCVFKLSRAFQNNVSSINQVLGTYTKKYHLCPWFLSQNSWTLVISQVIGALGASFAIIFGLSPQFLTQELLEPLESPERWGSFCKLMRQLVAGSTWRASGWGLDARGISHVMGGLEL